jgi:predicted TIM-barrel fold metal-dependent hydrolase
MAEQILADHSFFTLQHDAAARINLSNGVEYHGAVVAQPHPALNTAEGIEKVLGAHQRSVDDALKELFLYDDAGDGLFWALKMYPRLGYAPDDFAGFPCLEKLYEACVKKNIPITVHCAPGGMSAADYFLYERYDGGIVKNRYDLRDAENRFDGIMPGTVSKDSPVQWASVLKRFPKLKLCLAHFGGYDTWRKVGSFEDAEMNSTEAATGSNKSEYTDNDYYRDWIKTIAELVQQYENVYTDLSYFMNEPIVWPAISDFPEEADKGNRYIAKNLVFLLNKYTALKDRILVGTDWYMIETEGVKGMGDYLQRMFETLKMVSREVGFDAWHQFAVVNPLRYFGLIEEAKGSAGPFEVKAEVLGRFGERLKGRLESRSQNIDNSNADNIIGKKITEAVTMFNQQKIADSKAILRNGKLLVLCE